MPSAYDRTVGRPSSSALRASLLLEVLAVAMFVTAQQLISRRVLLPGETAGGFFDDPAPAILMIGAASAAVAAGVVALASLLRHPLETPRGRWAMRLAVAAALFLPLMGAIAGLASLLGHGLPDGWGEPVVPIWLLVAAASVLLGLFSGAPDRRGVLVAPFVFGAIVLGFVLGEILAPH